MSEKNKGPCCKVIFAAGPCETFTKPFGWTTLS